MSNCMPLQQICVEGVVISRGSFTSRFKFFDTSILLYQLTQTMTQLDDTVGSRLCNATLDYLIFIKRNNFL